MDTQSLSGFRSSSDHLRTSRQAVSEAVIGWNSPKCKSSPYFMDKLQPVGSIFKVFADKRVGHLLLINLPNAAYLQNLENFLNLIRNDGLDGVTFRMRDGLFSLHPLVLCMVAALTDRPYDAGSGIAVEYKEENSSIRYLERMQLFNHMHLPLVVPVKAHEPAGRFIPLTRISNNDELNRFIADFVPLLHSSPGEAEAIKYVLYELVRNVLEHSRSSHGAYAAAQVLKKSGRLLIGVADSGIGVRASISRSHQVLDDANAIELAFRPGVTGTTSRYGGNETNGGAGLFFMKAMASLGRHHMVMVSGTTMMKLLTQPKKRKPEIHTSLKQDRVTWYELPTPFSGTAVGLDLTVEDTIAFSALLTEIREVYHLNVKKNNKERRLANFA